jgi:hypothetical protein
VSPDTAARLTGAVQALLVLGAIALIAACYVAESRDRAHRRAERADTTQRGAR